MSDKKEKIDDMDLDFLEDFAAYDIENETDESSIDIAKLDDKTKELLGVDKEEDEKNGESEKSNDEIENRVDTLIAGYEERLKKLDKIIEEYKQDSVSVKLSGAMKHLIVITHIATFVLIIFFIVFACLFFARCALRPSPPDFARFDRRAIPRERVMPTPRRDAPAPKNAPDFGAFPPDNGGDGRHGRQMERFD